MEALGTWLDSRGCSEASLWHRISKGNCVIPNFQSRGVLTPFIRSVLLRCFMVVVNGLHAVHVSGTAHLGTWRRVLCLRRRPNECWAYHMKRTGPTVARQLKKHGEPRLQTLAMRRVRTAAWQMVRCPDDAKGRGCWEESVTWRCDEEWREAHITLSKEDYRNTTQWKRPLPGRPNYWDRPFTRFLGDAWISKTKACKTWAEWNSLTKEVEQSWNVMLNLKPPESSCASCDGTRKETS